MAAGPGGADGHGTLQSAVLSCFASILEETSHSYGPQKKSCRRLKWLKVNELAGCTLAFTIPALHTVPLRVWRSVG